MTSRAAAEQIGTGVPKMDALGAKVKHCRMLDDTSMQERGHETQDADPESKAQHNNGAIEPKDAGAINELFWKLVQNMAVQALKC